MPNDNLVSVETQTEYSATSGKSETRIFLKVYVDAIKSGLIGDMGAERWQTLCVIAGFMNEKGECWPTQSQIADKLNIRRESVSKRVKALADYTWNGRHLIQIIRERDEHTKQWTNTRYTILPISQIAIFNGESEPLVQ